MVMLGIGLLIGIAVGFLLRTPPPVNPADVPPPPRATPSAPTGASVDEVRRDPEVLALVDSDRKIDAIKRVRERTGLGLKESKDVVDAISKERGR